ncbi:mitogen-activated protein kinase-binding protein 1-like protein [Corchorus olitorius]|uniref:Mitogen-activated protein kinase-binding protein 1-like protein n=1 Tax=Corchorus olitorius TaxID=93759 RepID=A0A1R3FYH2_9ROSI|nr:mitogen-activated protein kinase-binding protein 1-like protein [Corchorus olitorius]
MLKRNPSRHPPIRLKSQHRRTTAPELQLSSDLAQNSSADSPRRPEYKSGLSFVGSSPQLPRSSFYRTEISL